MIINSNVLIIKSIIAGGKMERTVFWRQILMDYICNNELNIDKATYFTVLIGQITIYGILLTFYQFVASYQGNKKAVNQYLGINIAEFFVKKNVKFFNKIISKKYFGGIILLEFLYKPFITVYGGLISTEVIRFVNFLWYFFAVTYFCLFAFLFFRCTKSILMIKLYSSTPMNDLAIDEINKNFIKKTVKEQITQNAIELLEKDMDNLRVAIQIDDDTKLQKKYNCLINIIFGKYTTQKKNKKSITKEILKRLNKQISWIYNVNREVYLLQEILEEKYFTLDEENIWHVFRFGINLLNENFEQAKLEGYEEIRYDRYGGHHNLDLKEIKIFYVGEWKDIWLKIYRKLSDKEKQKYICCLTENFYLKKKIFYQSYCEKCIECLIQEEVESILEGKREQKDFIKIFKQAIQDESINKFYMQVLCDEIVGYDKVNIEKIIALLNEKNATYLFTYIIMYYSIYKFSFEWEYINLNMLKLLWKQHGNMEENAEFILKEIKHSDIQHRFSKEMYNKFMEYIYADIDGKLFRMIYDENILNMFYIWVIKMCIINEDDARYTFYKDDYDIDIQIIIINELSRHEELLTDNNICGWLDYVKYSTSKKQMVIPPKLVITLRSLLLTNINAMIVADYVKDNPYLYVNAIGKYLLVKLQELPDNIQQQGYVKEIIRNAFISDNMSIDKYITIIEKECCVCKSIINYVRKEKMIKYLMKIL